MSNQTIEPNTTSSSSNERSIVPVILGGTLMACVLGIMIGSKIWTTHLIDQQKESIEKMIQQSSARWGSLEPVGELVDVRQRLSNRRGLLGSVAQVDGREIVTPTKVIPIRGELSYQPNLQVRIARLEDSVDVVCVGNDLSHQCYLSHVISI